jgi:hypothetical protein
MTHVGEILADNIGEIYSGLGKISVIVSPKRGWLSASSAGYNLRLV